jgi:hypothetical protein
VNPAVVWADRESALSVEHPAVVVWTLDRLPEELGNIWHGQTLDETALARVTDTLTGLCARQAE